MPYFTFKRADSWQGEQVASAMRAGLTGADGYDVTGGMLSKVESMVELVEAHPSLDVGVISGLEPDQVYAALTGQPLTGGTVIRA